VTDPAPTPAPPKDDTLWCVNVLGPTDVHACRSRAEAFRFALWLNLSYLRLYEDPHPLAPVVQAVVAPWPHSPESHAEDLVRRDREERRWAADPKAALVALAIEVIPGLQDTITEELDAWRDWSNELSELVPEDCPVGNPEGDQESILTAWFTHLTADRDRLTAENMRLQAGLAYARYELKHLFTTVQRAVRNVEATVIDPDARVPLDPAAGFNALTTAGAWSEENLQALLSTAEPALPAGHARLAALDRALQDQPKRLPTGRPGYLGMYQGWPCARCGKDCDENELHVCVPKEQPAGEERTDG
jgi:hypothetical protein